MTREKMVLNMFFVYNLFFVLEAPLRYFLQSVNVSFFIYIRDFILVASVVMMIEAWVQTLRINYRIFIAVLIIISGALWGGYLNGIFQTLFGIKVILPFFFGVFLSKYYCTYKTYFYNMFSIFFMIICTGILLEYFVPDLPWNNLNESVMGIEVASSMTDEMYGMRRILGFGRSIFYNSMLLYLSYIFVFLKYEHCIKKLIFLTIIGCFCVLLTTAKGAIGSFFIALILLVLYKFKKTKYVGKLLSILLTILFSIGMIMFPVYAIFSTSGFDFNDEISLILFSSFNVRLLWTWPTAYQIINEYGGNELLGLGIGGMGASSWYFSPERLYSPLDNGFVWLFGYFGLISLIIIGYYIVKVIRMNGQPAYEIFFPALMFNGMFICVFEFPLPQILLGMIIMQPRTIK